MSASEYWYANFHFCFIADELFEGKFPPLVPYQYYFYFTHRRDNDHARALEALRTDHAAVMEDKNLTIARQQAELARMDDQYREPQREKAQAVEAQRMAEAKAIEAQRKADATIALLKEQRDAEAAKAKDLESGMRLQTDECERLRALTIDLERRLQRERSQQAAVSDRSTPRFLRRIRGQS